MHAETLHHAVAAGNGAVGHHPHHHMRRFRHQRNKVPESIVRGRGLRHREMRLRLGCMHEIRKFHRVLNEKDRNVVSDQIPIALFGVELDRESAHITHGIG